MWHHVLILVDLATMTKADNSVEQKKERESIMVNKKLKSKPQSPDGYIYLFE